MVAGDRPSVWNLSSGLVPNWTTFPITSLLLKGATFPWKKESSSLLLVAYAPNAATTLPAPNVTKLFFKEPVGANPFSALAP